MDEQEAFNKLTELEEFFFYRRLREDRESDEREALDEIHSKIKSALNQWHDLTGYKYETLTRMTMAGRLQTETIPCQGSSREEYKPGAQKQGKKGHRMNERPFIGTISFDVNNDRTLSLIQRGHDGDTLICSVEKQNGEYESIPDEEAFIAPGDFVMLMNLYRLVRRSGSENAFIKPAGAERSRIYAMWHGGSIVGYCALAPDVRDELNSSKDASVFYGDDDITHALYN